MNSRETPSRIPVLVVGGFLGSGKTSLVRHLLDDAAERGRRLAVVSNEFGDLGIDAALLAAADDDYVELSGGCVCCKLSDELLVTLEALRRRAEPDAIVLETSGVALPFETQLQLWRDPVRQWVEDDIAVVVVNAEQLASGRDLDDTFEQQVSSADLLVLNQLDRVTDAALARLEATLREIEPEAPILHTTHGRVDPVLLFPPDPSGVRSQRRTDAPAPPSHHHERFDTTVVELEAGQSLAAVEATLAALGALRLKGFVETSAGWRVVQGVGPRLELQEIDAPPAGSLPGRIVAITRSVRPRP
jgi:cobalamin biosynthesis protein CobW